MSFWLKDNKIIIKDGKFVKCDKCPCGGKCGAEIYTSGYEKFKDDDEDDEQVDWESEVEVSSIELKVGDLEITNNVTGNDQYNSFAGLPCPTKPTGDASEAVGTVGLSGSVTVTFASSVVWCNINSGFGGDVAAMVRTEPIVITSKAGFAAVTKSFTLVWEYLEDLGGYGWYWRWS